MVIPATLHKPYYPRDITGCFMHNEQADVDRVKPHVDSQVPDKDATPEIAFRAGQSKRIWGELYKVSVIT